MCFRTCRLGGGLVRGIRVEGCIIWTASDPYWFCCKSFLQVLLWHWRLGYPSVQRLRSVVPITSFVFTLGCESCELGKHHRATYQSRVNNRSSSAFELVHSDVWGPSRVPFIKSFRYFLVFVDDFSHMTWLYLLQERLEVSKVNELFSNEIKKSVFYFHSYTSYWQCLGLCQKWHVYLLFQKIELFIRHHALIHPNKIVLLNANIDILWMSLGPWWFIWMFPNICSLMLC